MSDELNSATATSQLRNRVHTAISFIKWQAKPASFAKKRTFERKQK